MLRIKSRQVMGKVEGYFKVWWLRTILNEEANEEEEEKNFYEQRYSNQLKLINDTQSFQEQMRRKKILEDKKKEITSRLHLIYKKD